jgi:pimeloyl-ACP methyl ester carboxylesterase
LTTHGWHGHVTRPDPSSQNPYPDFVTVQVDMRGRKYSTGQPDCNGYELYDFYDAYHYVVKNYPEYLSDPDLVYFKGGSGGGGNGYALLGKFPDLFVSAVISCGISDYALWFEGDSIGEFRDEMLPWIGAAPAENRQAYDSRSGITTVQNILTPVFIVHGETDIRVPSSHARNYLHKAKQYNKTIEYLELAQVGTRAHWGNITDEQLDEKEAFINKGLTMYTQPPHLPAKGTLIVAGFVVTKYFSVFLESVNHVANIHYDLDSKTVVFKNGNGRVSWHQQH